VITATNDVRICCRFKVAVAKRLCVRDFRYWNTPLQCLTKLSAPVPFTNIEVTSCLTRHRASQAASHLWGPATMPCGIDLRVLIEALPLEDTSASRAREVTPSL
jgi:hypothetical protein